MYSFVSFFQNIRHAAKECVCNKYMLCIEYSKFGKCNCSLRTEVLLYLTKKLQDSVTPGLRDFSFFLSSTFVYEPILLNISMNANIVKTQIFNKIKYDLKGQ